jgi:hypothetical protein
MDFLGDSNTGIIYPFKDSMYDAVHVLSKRHLSIQHTERQMGLKYQVLCSCTFIYYDGRILVNIFEDTTTPTPTPPPPPPPPPTTTITTPTPTTTTTRTMTTRVIREIMH